MDGTWMIYGALFAIVLVLSVGWVAAIDREPKDYNGEDLFGEDN